ncbi:MAG: glycosyltransferase [Candidatus Promineofilum sp.]|nr:glycosyltransferase [Promineifilum sp.]
MNVTVGITSYNQRDYLIQAVDSVLAQTAPPAEILIVDDASTDDSPQLIAAYAGRHPDLIRPLLLSRNGGPNAARNHVIAAASGDYLAFLDGDDRWRPAKLARALDRLNAPDHPDAVFDNFVFTDGDGRPLFIWADGQRPPEGRLLRQVLTLAMPRTTLFRAELVPTALWRAAGGYDPSFAIYGDWDARIRQAQQVGRYAYVDEVLSEYRRHGAGLSSRGVEAHLAAVDHVEGKYADLIAQLERDEGGVMAGLRRWRAKLLRRAALDVALRRTPGFRAAALGYYRRSLAYHRAVDARTLWHMVKP